MENREMSEALTKDDPRYRELFDAAKEAAVSNNGAVYGDFTQAMNALRDAGPVHKGSLRELLGLPSIGHYSPPREHYTIFSFEACNYAFRNAQFFSSKGVGESPTVQALGTMILTMDGEQHRRLRATAQPMFLLPKVLGTWKQNWIDDTVDTLLDRLVGQDTADLNFDLCARLPMHVASRGIGLRGDQALDFRDQLIRATIMHELPAQERGAAMAVVCGMLKELIDERRAVPADDVVSALVAADLELEDGGTRKLTEEEIFSFCRLILLAGGGTTWRQLGITIHALLTNGFWDACRKDRSLVPVAIEESARWCPTDPMFMRLTTQDVEIGGTVIPGGSRVDVCLGAANRDPARWDNPDAYDIYRTPHTHLGFAIGPHQCLGINVAKQEMISAINGLLDRFPDMRLDPDQPPPTLVGAAEQRGMSAVPVRLH
jgi:cytochrome P450